ncbi:uncharacterized protein PAC_07463 [Phialocephala subalpina]|uniref:Mtf2-like C-terminal domain-containing protein n=1 Tax=Phialocephala subalpina TaxID=576137 RepID=A0A1L7WXS4_9HELO|nr:uncharacterized protein PAC_07463 [Phialocephala subalpina]
MLTSKVVAGTTAMSTTMLPFLYQTKTLSSLLLTTQGSIRRLPCHRTISRSLSISVRRRAFDPDSIPTTTAQDSSDDKSQIKNSTYDFKAESAGSRRSIPESTKVSAGYNLRRASSKVSETTQAGEGFIRRVISNAPETTRSSERNGRGVTSRSRQDDFDDDFSMPGTIDFEGVGENVPGESNAAYQPRESTITDREKAAFQKIFSNIFECSNINPKAQDENAVTGGSSGFTRTGDGQRAKTALHSILTGAIQKQGKTRLEIEQAISRYPLALRDDAAKAMLRGDESPPGNVDNYEVDEEEERVNRVARKLQAEELEALRAPERLRVETLMKEAKTDFELWQIMEQEVFSMIPKLGLEEKPEVAAPVDKTKKGWKKLQKQEEELQREQDELSSDKADVETEQGISPLRFHGPLYPSYLLLGLRLLDRSFAKPSPLALSILPKIKSLGFISHVLGASTQFYNDLLRIYRYRYDDFRGMIDLMYEMEASALDMDEETLTIVHDVMKMQASVKNSERGQAVQALWSMPEFAPLRFTSWRDRIKTSIRERKRDATTQVY